MLAVSGDRDSCARRRGWEAVVVDVVGEVVDKSVGGHAERGGCDLGVEGDDEVDDAGGSEPFWWHAGVVEDVAEVGGRGGRDAGLGDFRDDEVRVAGPLCRPV
jgi:hypothetical protein